MGTISGKQVREIIRLYSSNNSILETARAAGLSTVKVRKILITEGLWESDTSIKIGTLFDQGLTTEEIAEILEEIAENDIFKEKTKNLKTKKIKKVKKSNLTKNKNTNFNPLKYTIDGFTFLVGRNNKENDYLSLKYAHRNDIWFHTKDIHGSHAVLLLNGKTPSADILTKCAEITAYHSKARFSSNVPVDTCEVRYVKKPKGAKPGMVIYTNYSTLYVNPTNS